MSHLFSVSHQPVVGTLAKFPNQHLFWSKSYFSIGNLWATIEISISTQLSFKSSFNNIVSINQWLLKPWHFGKFHHWPCFVQQAMYGQMGNFIYFSLCLAHWLSKPWHFGKFCHWPCFVQQAMYGQMGNFQYFSFCLAHWLSKPWHFGKFRCLPTKICHFSNMSK